MGLPASDIANASIEADVRAVWVAFCVAVPLLVGLEACCLVQPRRGEAKVSVSTASWQCAFWVATGLIFNLFVGRQLGAEAGFGWLSGYLLEYMLSVDNLFCFHLIFTSYRTPKDQVHRALSYGIGGAVAFRFVLFAIGAGVFNLNAACHWIFGLVLIYSAVKMMAVSDEAEADPKESWLVQQISRVLPLHEDYAPHAAFFVYAAAGGSAPDRPASPSRDAAREMQLGRSFRSSSRGDLEGASDCELRQSRDAEAVKAVEGPQQQLSWCNVRVTLLFLVVVALGAVDVIFALDSVAAKISMVSQFEDSVDLLLNFTSSAFTMLTLRSLYFLIASLVHVFRLMKYGVGLILALIGIKLMLSAYIKVEEGHFCGVLLAVFLLSIVASLLLPAPTEQLRSCSDQGCGV